MARLMSRVFWLQNKYGTDPINAHHVSSKSKFSNVTADNTGTYTCQCDYNQNVIINHNQDIVSNTTSFCLKVSATCSPAPADTG